MAAREQAKAVPAGTRSVLVRVTLAGTGEQFAAAADKVGLVLKAVRAGPARPRARARPQARAPRRPHPVATQPPT